jgi:hypothetical protein
VTNRREHISTVLESVLGATPQEFESLILRDPDLRKRDRRRLRTCLDVETWLSFWPRKWPAAGLASACRKACAAASAQVSNLERQRSASARAGMLSTGSVLSPCSERQEVSELVARSVKELDEDGVDLVGGQQGGTVAEAG